jgi:drug/metabolite transporter (DMT)-like permease
MVSFRFTFFALSSYYFIFKNNIKIPSIFELKNKKWFYIRIISNFLGLLTYKFSFDYIRLGLSLSLVMFAPIWGNFFSIFFFKEKFDIKYLIGCVFCLLGTYLIGLGEDKGHDDEFNIGTLIGILFGISNSFCTATIIMSSKFLMKTYDTYELNFTLGVYIAFFAFFLSFLQFDKILYSINLNFIFFTALNGIVTFFAFHFSNISLKLAPYNKISYIGYTQIVFSLIAGMLLFGESLNFLDFVGSFIIIGYNVISSKYFS